MPPSQYDLKAVFLGALDRAEGAERAAYLDDACRGGRGTSPCAWRSEE